MNGIAEIIAKAAAAAAEDNPVAEGDYKDEDGFLCCGKCRTPKQTRITLGDESLVVSCMCECEAERVERERAAEREAQRRRAIESKREYCITDGAYRKLNFASDNDSCPKAIEAARWYVENFEQLKAENKGLLFMGTVGTGKTFAACCIANELVERGADVWLTTMLPLLRSAGDFNKCDAVFSRVESVDLLILDDFGTTKNTERNNELLFEIIDTRARSGKPLIITTNLTQNNLKNPSDLSLARIYDRVIAMCSSEKSPVVLDGTSIRREIAREKHRGTVLAAV